MKKSGTAALILAAVLCSIGGVCIKYIPWSPMAINGARCAIAAGITGAHLHRKRHRLRMNVTVLCGALSLTLTTVLYVFATKLTSTACAVLLLYTAPVWVLAFGRLVHRQPPAPGADLAAAGTLLGLCFFAADGLAGGRLPGNVLGLLSGVSYAGVFVFGADADGDAESSWFLGQLLGAAAGLPFLGLERSFPLSALACAALLGVFQLGLSYLLMAWGLARTNAFTASLTTALEPILAPVWAALLCRELPTRAAQGGMALVLVSVAGYSMLAARAQRRPSA